MKAASTLRGTFASLEDRRYRFFWLSCVAMYAAMQMQIVVRLWLVYDLSGSALDLGLVGAAAGVPILLVSPYAGVIADRVDKRSLLIASQGLAAILTLLVAVLITLEAIAVWHLIVASIAHGIVVSFNMPTRQAMVPQLVEEHRVMNAVALFSGSVNLNRVAAPALGGVLVGVMGIDGVYYLIVGFNIFSALLLFPVSPDEKPIPLSSQGIVKALVQGLSSVRRSPALLGLLTMAVVPIIFGMPYQMLLPVFSEDILDVGVSGLGYLMAAAGVGALTGSTFVAILGDYSRKGLLLLVACGLFGIFLALFAYSSNFYLSLLFLFAVGMASATYMAINQTLLLTNADDSMRGRVMSLYMMTIGLFPIAVLPVGAIVEVAGAPIVIGASGAILAVFTIAMALWRPVLRKL